MSGMTVEIEEYLLLHPGDQALQKLRKHRGIDTPFNRHELEMSQAVDGGDHVETIAYSRGLDHRRLASWSPCGPRMVILADARFISK